MSNLLQQRGGRLEEFDHRHFLAVFDGADKGAEAARELHLALISTDPPTAPIQMSLHAGNETPGKNAAKGPLASVVRSMAGLADHETLLLSDDAWRGLAPALQGSAVDSLKPVPQGAGTKLYELPWTEPTTAERTRMVTMMWNT